MNTTVGLAARAAVRALAQAPAVRPRLIAITGCVAVGKSVFARALRRSLLRRLGVSVPIVGSDGFLRSDAELERASLLDHKGFPESYDQLALSQFFATLARGERVERVPQYSHQLRGVAGFTALEPTGWLIVEGVYSVQPARASGLPCFAVFLEAELAAIERWYLARWQRLGRDAARARETFERVNCTNYHAHIAPLREQADLVLYKAQDHALRSAR